MRRLRDFGDLVGARGAALRFGLAGDPKYTFEVLLKLARLGEFVKVARVDDTSPMVVFHTEGQFPLHTARKGCLLTIKAASQPSGATRARPDACCGLLAVVKQ